VAADDVILMSEGRLVARGAPPAVLAPARVAEVFGVVMHAHGLPPVPWRLAQPAKQAEL
jgi:iron complex transport system ATP-binding protein